MYILVYTTFDCQLYLSKPGGGGKETRAPNLALPGGAAALWVSIYTRVHWAEPALSPARREGPPCFPTPDPQCRDVMKKFHGAKIILVPLSRQSPQGHPHRRVRGCGPGGTPSREQGLKLGEGPQSKCPPGWFSMLRPWKGYGAPGAPGAQRPGLWRCLRTSCALAPGGLAPKEGHPCALVSALRPGQPTEGGGCYYCVGFSGGQPTLLCVVPRYPSLLPDAKSPCPKPAEKRLQIVTGGKGGPGNLRGGGEMGGHRWGCSLSPHHGHPRPSSVQPRPPLWVHSPDPSPPSLFSWTPKRSSFGDNAGLG